ncbi:MAG: aggregation factor core [Pseudomonadota bacterium]
MTMILATIVAAPLTQATVPVMAPAMPRHTVATRAAAAALPPLCGPSARVTFREGAPVDVYTVENLSPGDWAIAAVDIGLIGSAGRLVFDTVPGGAGRNVAQPFRAFPGEAALADMPLVPDGAEAMALSFAAFPTGARFQFSIDMDDRLAGWGTTVQGPEIEGATVTVTFVAGERRSTLSAAFDARAVAEPLTACLG